LVASAPGSVAHALGWVAPASGSGADAFGRVAPALGSGAGATFLNSCPFSSF